jgi:cytoskeletal protein RodZ
MPERTAGGFGAKLRDARERRGMSLRQIANATKISIAALEALERNDILRLPGGIFSRAFVRSYAVEVGLDPEATIQEFIAQFPNDSVTAGHPASDPIEDHQAVESDRRTAGTFLWLAAVSVPIAGAVLYFATAGRPLIREGAAPAAAASDQSAEPGRAADPPAPPVSETVPASAPPQTPSPPLASPPAPLHAVAPASATPPSASPSSDAAPADAVGRLAVQLSARRPCWVTAVVDGRRVMDRLLAAGEQTTVDVRREMVLTAGDAGALTLTINGAEARPLGKAGEVVTARFNPANFKTYLQTR